ncbi:hypothetical protein NIES4071_101980 (plasmid) [Calothrix sp. NIES-4071]|nr:hypothetical protein NIES4071_101980 [Calothrix sp. NIES-4071]BAZ64579.1 hypothetical protein NIES4105_103120 [Calothrix sp. NIES-4105]
MIQRLVTYYPTCINENGYLIQSVSTEVYVQHPGTNQWYLIMHQGANYNWKAVIDEWSNSNSSNNIEEITYFKNWRDFFTNSGKQRMPIQTSSTYLTLQGAINHSIRWMWRRDRVWNSPMKTTAPSKIELYLASGLPGSMSANSCFAMPFTFDSKSPNGIIELDEPELEPYYTCFFDGKENHAENTRLAIEALKSSQPDAAIQLLGVMQVIASTCFEDDWGDNYVFGLYEIIHTIIQVEDIEYGKGIIFAHQIILLCELLNRCQGWWYNEGNDAIFKSIN